MGGLEEQRDKPEPDPEREIFAGENLKLRDVSARLLAAINAVRDLEREARKVPMGSPEFRQLSAEIAARSREVFNLAYEQEEVARDVPPQDVTIDDLDRGELA